MLVLGALTPYTMSLDDIKVPLCAILGGICLVAVAWVAPAPERYPREIRHVLKAIAVWLAIAGISAVCSRYRWIAVQQAVAATALTGLILGVALAPLHRTDLLAILYAWLVFAFVEQALAYAHLLGGIDQLLALLYPQVPQGLDRFYLLLATFAGSRQLFGTILNEDFYAGWMLTVIPPAVAVIFVSRSIAWRLFAYAVALMGTVGLLLSFSKDSMLGLAAALGVVLLLTLRAFGGRWFSRHTRTILISMGVATLLALALIFLSWDRLMHEVATLGGAFSSRGVIWAGALGIAARFPLLGGGPGTFRIYFAEFRRPDYLLHEVSNVTYSAHNLYLDALAETGVPGFLALLGVLGLVGWASWRAFEVARRCGDPLALLHGAFLAAMIATAVQNCFSPAARWTVGHAYLGATFGLALAAARLTLAEHAAGSEAVATTGRGWRIPRAAFIVFASLLWLIGSYQGVRYWRGAVLHAKGMEQLETGDFAAAVVAFRAAVAANPTSATTLYKLGHAIHSHAARDARDGEKLEQAARDADAVYQQLEELWPRYAEVSYNVALLNRLVYERQLAALRQRTDGVEGATSMSPEDRLTTLRSIVERMERANAAAVKYREQTVKVTARQMLGEILRDRALLLRDFGKDMGKGPDEVDKERDALLSASSDELESALDDFAGQVAQGIEDSQSLRKVRLWRSAMETSLARDDWERASELGEELYRLRSEDTDLAGAIVTLYLKRLKQPAKAVDAARRFAQDDPLDPVRRLDLVSTAVDAGDAASALQELPMLRALLEHAAQADPAYRKGGWRKTLEELERNAQAILLRQTVTNQPLAEP